MPITIWNFAILRDGDRAAAGMFGPLWFWFDGGPNFYVS